MVCVWLWPSSALASNVEPGHMMAIQSSTGMGVWDDSAGTRVSRDMTASVATAQSRSRMLSLAIRYGADDPEDVVQDALVTALERGTSFRFDCSPTTWLHRVVVNKCHDRWRRRMTRRRALAVYLPHRTHAVLPTVVEKRALKTALATLTTRQRRVCLLHDVLGWTHEEIAARLGCPVGTSKSTLPDARRRLRSAL